mmetsp:Transcript_9833/g.12384  ORF Transcript_9833/g.12384 Transcript_9833/m.12384 type:complete len:126 (+) Transcript_9833:47-424(+)
MIVLPIAKSEEDDTPQEWSLFELNGELLPSNKDTEGDHMEFGMIELDGDGKTAKITIASHELKGKVEVLKQPFIVMRPCKRPITDTEASETTAEGVSKKQRSGYEVAGIVKSKILFDQYPKSIMR